MLLSIIIFLLSIVPSVLVFILLRNRHKGDTLYRKSCSYAFISGLISVLPILILSAVLFIMNAALKLTLLKDANILVYKAIYKFIVLAFAEEFIKYLVFRFVLKRKKYSYSWADVTAIMVIVGTAFGLMEALPYAFDASPMMMLVRGFTMGHVGYGFIMGWFYGKRLYTGKKKYAVISVLLPWLLHGIYDFSLTPELLEVNENLMFIALFMALLDIVMLILMIRFFIRSKKQERYMQSVCSIEKKNTL